MNMMNLKPLQAAVLALLMASGAGHATAATTAVAPTVKSTPKSAATPAQEAQRRFREEMAFCASGQSDQGRRVCEQEARAALAVGLRGALAAQDTNFSQHAKLRCEALPAGAREVCLRRVDSGADPSELRVVPGSETPLQASTPPRQ